jgi:hypothetical protein
MAIRPGENTRHSSPRKVIFMLASFATSQATQVGAVMPRFRMNRAYRIPEALHNVFINVPTIGFVHQGVQFALVPEAGPVGTFFNI